MSIDGLHRALQRLTGSQTRQAIEGIQLDLGDLAARRDRDHGAVEGALHDHSIRLRTLEDAQLLRRIPSELTPVGRPLPLPNAGNGLAADDVLNALVSEVIVGPVVDVRCGSGQLMAMLRDRGLSVYGVDESWEAVGFARERGLSAFTRSALDYLSASEAAQLGAVLAVQVIERLPAESAVAVLGEAYRVLGDAGRLVLGLLDADYVSAGRPFWLLDVTAIRADSLVKALEQIGFSDVTVSEPFLPPDFPPAITADLVVAPTRVIAATKGNAR